MSEISKQAVLKLTSDLKREIYNDSAYREGLEWYNQALIDITQSIERGTFDIEPSGITEQLEIAVNVLRWYENKENYKLQNSDVYDAGGFAEYNVLGDEGCKAREALERIGKVNT